MEASHVSLEEKLEEGSKHGVPKGDTNLNHRRIVYINVVGSI